MSDINTIFCRALLKNVHADIRASFPEIPHVVAACSVLRTDRRCWFAEIDTPGRPRFIWDGRADNATHARAEAWQSFMRKYAPDQDGDQ